MKIKNHLQQLLNAGLIRKFKSPWSSNAVLCRKKDKSFRMCIYDRKLNSRTMKDFYALPRPYGVLDDVKQFFFYNSGHEKLIPSNRSTRKTRGTHNIPNSPLGFYEFNRMPFEFCDAP